MRLPKGPVDKDGAMGYRDLSTDWALGIEPTQRKCGKVHGFGGAIPSACLPKCLVMSD